MDSGARFLIVTLVLALCLGIGVILLDKNYRPKKIAETNRGVFTNIPFDASGRPPDAADPQ